jgi:hypothetical protein
MKTITLIILSFFAYGGITQAANLPLDFESGTFNITNFDGGVLTVVSNPHSTGINTSAKVAQMVKNTGENWAGAYITLDNTIDFSSGKTFKMKVYSPKVGTKVLLKVQNAVDDNIYFQLEVATKLANQWEELVFDFSKIDAGQTYRKVVIIFDLGTVGNGSANFTYLLDDLVLGQGVSDDVPATAAPTPPAYGSGKVISILSDAYTDVDGTNFNPNWGQATVGSIVELNGGKVLKLLSLNYQGAELFSDVNAASMKYLHIDVWTANETSLEIYPISRTTGEKKIKLTPIKLREWNSYNIKLSDILTSSYNLADLFQFKFIGAGGNTVYIDNLYFYDDNPVADTEGPKNFTATLSTITYNSIKLLLNSTDNSGAINYYITVGGTTTKVGAASGIQKSYEFTRLPSSTEFSFSITAKDLSENDAANNPIQLLTNTLQAFPEPATSAPVPPARNSGDVISIFSNSYTNIANTNFNPYWQQSTWYESKFIAENEMVKYENFNYQGIEIGSKVNASGMQYLHIDVWTPNETSLKISPISQSSGEKAVQLMPLNLNGWNSYNIPLSSFTIQGLSVADILHLKLVGTGKSIIYIDNIYFYKGNPTSLQQIEKESVVVYNFYRQLVVKTSNELMNGQIDIFDISGRKMMTRTITNQTEMMEMSKLGMMLVRISDMNKQTIITKKVMVK